MPPGIARVETMSVVTGGPLPLGTDAVVPIEEPKRTGRKVIFAKQVRRGDFVFPAGADVRKGDPVIARGNTIRAQDVGILVMLGLKSHVTYPATRVEVVAACNNNVHAEKDDAEWIAKALPEGTYGTPNEVLTALLSKV